MIRNFIWTGHVSKRKLVTVAWSKICRPMEEGGLGFRSFKATNKALLLKMAWQIMEGSNPLLHLLRDRYINKFGEVRSTGILSSIWSSIRPYYKGLLRETLWIIGEHSVIKFWTSNWLGSTIASRMDRNLTINWNATISDYFSNGIWKLPPVLDNYEEIKNEIRNIEIRPGHIDKLIWKKNLHGEVTTRSAFDTSINHFPKVAWGKWIWEAFIPPKKSLLVWRIIHNALPTLESIRKRGIPIAPVCSFCLNNSDNIDHIFMECNFPNQIWRYFLNLLNLNVELNFGFNNSLIQIMKLQLSPSLKSLVKAMFMAITWTIWEARNKCVFEDKRPYISRLIASIWSSLNELKFFKLGGFHANQKELLIAYSFQLPFHTKSPLRVKEVYWAPPPSQWVKVNVDGSAKGAPGELTSAGIFRSGYGLVEGCFVSKMGIGLALEAELWAAILAIEIAHNKGWNRLWMESDSALVVELLKNKSKMVPWKIIPRWLHCLHIINKMEFGITHIYREGNRVADHLTSIKEYSFKWWQHCPDFLWPFVCKDIQQQPYFRFY